MKAMGYAVVGVGPIDEKMGDNYYKLLKDKGIAVVNLGTPENLGAKPFVIRKLGGVRVAVFSFGPMPQGGPEDFATLKQRFQMYGEARQKADIVVILDQSGVATDEWIDRITKKYGAPDVILGGTRNMVLAQPKNVGDTMIVPTGVQGTAIGRVDIELAGAAKKKTYTRVQIEESFTEDPEVLKMVKDYNNARLIASGLQATLTNPTPNANMGSYYNYQTCVSCHKAEYDQWKTTKHAVALKTLEREQKTLSECLPCHSEMYRKIQRASNGADGFGGVECMSCHASVVPHNASYKAKHDPTATRAACKECHTPEHSPAFQLGTYLKSVKHVK